MLGLTLDELLEVVRTCQHFELANRDRQPLQHFLAMRLEDRWPTLALAVLDSLATAETSSRISARRYNRAAMLSR
jgi:hypothetical protein